MTDPDRPDSSAPDGDGWRFDIDDVGEGPQRRVREPIEPESPSPENAFFVLVGAAAALSLFATALLPL